jgi:hypothetical protein
MEHLRRIAIAVLISALGAIMACAPAIRSTAPQPVTDFQLAEFWEAPENIAERDLYWGPWGEELAPKRGQTPT